MAIEKLDLNLFKVFEAVLRNRGVSGAARELNLTASAVSHALARLRQAIGDELFVPGESGMEPTARARELAPGVRDGLERISLALNAGPFVPSESVRTFRFAATDHLATAILPGLVGRLTREAPNVNLRVFPPGRLDVVRELDEGRLDFVVGWFRDLPDRMRRTRLVSESEAVVVRTGHPLTQGPVTKSQLLAYPHIVVEITGTETETADGYLDDRGVLRRVWIERLLIETDAEGKGSIGRVAVSVPHFASVGPILRVSDMVATLPGRVAKAAAKQGGLVVLDLPYEPLTVWVETVWHQRSDHDPAIQWLIRLLSEVVEPME